MLLDIIYHQAHVLFALLIQHVLQQPLLLVILDISEPLHVLFVLLELLHVPQPVLELQLHVSVDISYHHLTVMLAQEMQQPVLHTLQSPLVSQDIP